MRRASGSPAIGSAPLARTYDSGFNRVPWPAVRTSAGIIPPPPRLRRTRREYHVRPHEPELLAPVLKEAVIGIDDEILIGASECAGHRVDRLFVSLELDECANRRLVDGDHQIRRQIGRASCRERV